MKSPQLEKMLASGLSVQECAENMGLALSEVTALMEEAPVTLDEKLEAAKAGALRTVIDIAQKGENEVARLKAAQFILSTPTRGPAAIDKWGSYLDKMKLALRAHETLSLLECSSSRNLSVAREPITVN